MSCVWKGLIKKLNLEYKPLTLYNVIKQNNTKTYNVYHNGLKPSEQQLDENYERIERLSQDEVLNGYFCSSFDPLLFLVCELYQVSMVHKYNTTTINYEYVKDAQIIQRETGIDKEENENIEKKTKLKHKSKKNKRKITIKKSITKIKCFSDDGHFW